MNGTPRIIGINGKSIESPESKQAREKRCAQKIAKALKEENCRFVQSAPKITIQSL